MAEDFSPQAFIHELCAIGERQLAGERRAAELIIRTLTDHQVPFVREPFISRIPSFIGSTLTADGVVIPSFPTCFVSGSFEGRDMLVSSLSDTELWFYTPTINFNPRCANAFSRGNHSFVPSVAVRREDVDRLIRANEVHVETQVRPVDHETEYLLVGNTVNPKSILFCHFDSIGTGATDDAGGVATVFAHLVQYPERLRDSLYVFDGNEELSYDEPTYWGHGYRVFEERHEPLFVSAQKILVVDGVGNGPLTTVKNDSIIRQGFPLRELERWMPKVSILSGNYERLMDVYHSNRDVPDMLMEAHLREAAEAVERLCR